MLAIVTAAATYFIIICVKTRRLHLYRDGRLLKTYRAGVGTLATPTPRGCFTIVRKTLSRCCSRFIGLSRPNLCIHGTSTLATVGHAVTFGCIHMRKKDVEELYDLVPLGTRVSIR